MIYLLSKLFTGLFLLPGLIVTSLLAAAWFVRHRVRRLLAALALGLYFLSIHPVADRMLASYEEPFRGKLVPLFADAVVSLGGGNIRGNPLPLVDEAFKRHIYGLALAKERDIPLIVSGTGDEGYDEYQGLLDTMRAVRPLLKADDFNLSDTYVDHYAVVPETKSADTYENALFTAKLIGKKDPVVIVVTSAYHMKRALRLFRLAGIWNVYPAAVNFYTEPRAYKWSDFLPSMDALMNSYRAMHEFFGMAKVKMRVAKYRIRDKIGRALGQKPDPTRRY